MDMIRKLLHVEVKEIADRTLEIAGSTEDKDRMGDIIRASGWKLGPFKKNPVFMWAHNYDQPPIGRAIKVWVDKDTNRLMFNVEFAGPDIYEFADTVYKLYRGGYLHATSVGFIPLDWEGKSDENPYPKWEGNIYTSQELLELSAVPVPANSNALVSAREAGLITVKEFDNLSPQLKTEKYYQAAAPVSKPEETENTIRIPVEGEEGKHEDHEIKTIDIDADKGITALYCVDCKKIITYIFDKDNGWTMESAQEWVNEHSKSLALVEVTTEQDSERHFAIRAPLPGIKPPPNEEKKEKQAKVITQEQLGDDLDYTLGNIKLVGINAANMPTAVLLASEIIQRSTGADIPDNILTKVGAVLNAKNKERLHQIRQLAQEVLDSAGTAQEEDEKQVKPLTPAPDPEAIKRQRAQDVAEVTGLVIAHLRGKRLPK